MKRILSLLVLAALCVGCSSDRQSYLKVYNWGDYIDEDILPEFEEWYEEVTGEKVKVIYQTFDINETMLSKIEKGHEDYDVVCPSDYIIERMLRADLLLPLGRDFGDVPNWIDGNLSPFVKDWFGRIDGSGRDARDYAVGYMWGTTGILYNTRYVPEEEVHTWNIFRDPKYADRMFIKDAARDVYAPILIYLRQDEIKSGKVTMEELMMDSSDKSLKDFEDFMKEAKELVAGWEADFGKELMTQEKAVLNFTWSGDAVWAIEEAADVGVELDYCVPDEGSTVWFDGWVIPKYAKNVKAASYFINYLCRPDNAIRNMDYIGYVSAIGGEEVLESRIDEENCDPIDLSYFFGEGAESVCVDPVQYPDRSVIDRCVLEHDWGDETQKLIRVWSGIKGDNASPMTYAVIGLVFTVLLAAAIAKVVRKSRRQNSVRRYNLEKRKRKVRRIEKKIVKK